MPWSIRLKRKKSKYIPSKWLWYYCSSHTSDFQTITLPFNVKSYQPWNLCYEKDDILISLIWDVVKGIRAHELICVAFALDLCWHKFQSWQKTIIYLRYLDIKKWFKVKSRRLSYQSRISTSTTTFHFQ